MLLQSDSRCFFTVLYGIIFHKGKECYLFDEKNIKEVLIQGISSYIACLKEKLDYEPDPEMER